GVSSEDAFAHVEYVIRPDRIVEVRVERLDGAARRAAVQAESALGAANGEAATLCQGLADCHVALEAVRAWTLHLAVDVEHRRPLNIYHVAAGNHQIAVQILVDEHTGDVDFPTERLAVTLASEYGDIRPRRRDAASGGHHLREPGVEGLQREAARMVYLSEDGNLAAAVLHQEDVHLRPLDKAAGLQRLGDRLFGGRDRHAADSEDTDQRKRDVSIFGHPRFQGEVGILINEDADRVAGAKPILGELVLRLGAEAAQAREGEQEREQPALGAHGFPAARQECAALIGAPARPCPGWAPTVALPRTPPRQPALR